MSPGVGADLRAWRRRPKREQRQIRIGRSISSQAATDPAHPQHHGTGRYHMPTTRETILSALHALLQTQPAPVLRGEVLPERVPAAGLLILRDGDPGEPAVTLSPLRYHYQHRAEVEAVVQSGTGRDAAFDALAAGVGTALAADRTLGGLCDWVEAEAPRPVDLAVEGAATLKAAVIPIVLHYASDRSARLSGSAVTCSSSADAVLSLVELACEGGDDGSGCETARSRGHGRIRGAAVRGLGAGARRCLRAVEHGRVPGADRKDGVRRPHGDALERRHGLRLRQRADHSADRRQTRPRSCDRFLATAEKDLVSPRTPVDGLGDGAFSVLFDPDDPYQDHGAFVVFGAGPPTVAATVYAEMANRRRQLMAPAMASPSDCGEAASGQISGSWAGTPRPVTR